MQQMRNRAAPARRWEAHSPLAAIAEATDDTRWPARPHVAPSLQKILPASTYVIDDAADAAGCDFLVLDDFLAREQCRLLAFAFGERAASLLQSEKRPAGRELSFLHCAELSRETPAEAEAILNEVLHRAIQLTEQFYALTAGLHVAEAKLSRVRADGSAAIPSFGRAPMTRHHDFAGVLCLEAPGSGGEILFPEIEIAVKPVVGRFIAATGGRYHEFTALGISSGAQLLLSFALNFKPDFMSER
jgi:hypothetical protein